MNGGQEMTDVGSPSRGGTTFASGDAVAIQTPKEEDVPNFGRKWSHFPGKNKFYCNGRIITAPSIRFCLLSFVLIFFTFSLFISFDGVFLAKRVTIAVPIIGSILFICVIVNMFRTSCSDPGILPRSSVQEYEFIERMYASPNNLRPPPRTRDIIVNGQTIKSKYCFTCKMFRPPRASHCGVCDNCVDRFDHHCPFLGNCIGKRNYRSFYAFIVSLSFLALFVLSCSITHLVLLTQERGTFLEALRESPTSAVVVLISFFGMWTVLGLAGFHTYLIAVEQTTNEDIKGMFGRANSKNPYTRGNVCRNCCFVLCGPSQPSLIDARGKATYDYITSYPKKMVTSSNVHSTNNSSGKMKNEVSIANTGRCNIQQCNETKNVGNKEPQLMGLEIISSPATQFGEGRMDVRSHPNGNSHKGMPGSARSSKGSPSDIDSDMKNANYYNSGSGEVTPRGTSSDIDSSRRNDMRNVKSHSAASTVSLPSRPHQISPITMGPISEPDLGNLDHSLTMINSPLRLDTIM